MPRYLFPDGEIQTLSRRAATDVAAVFPVQEVDVTGQPVQSLVSTIATDIEHLRAHEQVGILQTALTEAHARVQEIEALLATAEDQLRTDVEDVTVRAAARAAEDAKRAHEQQAADGQLSTEG